MFKKKTLEEEIIRQCGKIMVLSDIEEAEEEKETEYVQEESIVNERIIETELSFEDIHAKKRRKYVAKEEFIYSLYNDLFQYFVIDSHGHCLRQKSIPSEMHQKVNESVQNENKGEEELLDNARKFRFNKGNNLERDKTIHFSFINGNSYYGSANKKKMEGEGLYKWHHGVQYKGQFKQSQIHGTGMLEWQSNCWYEGKFLKGYRHGKGTLIDRDYHRLYIGEWHMGQRHGKGYCHYAKSNSFEGKWSMSRRDGMGTYIYPSGAQYKGHWKNDCRHGNGIMAWSNGDVYYGEWKYGDMHGYGEYTWHGYCNRSLSWPQNISYTGNWCCNTRHGRGLLKLNSMGGGKYFGHWRWNKKHGGGVIIGIISYGYILSYRRLQTSPFAACTPVGQFMTVGVYIFTGNNGELIEGDPLYTKDILAPLFVEKLSETLEPCTTTILKPEQFPSMSYYINRLMKLLLIRKSTYSDPLGKCYICNKQQSCSCLLQSSFQATDDTNIQKNDFCMKWQYEKNQMHDCLTLHMSRIWHVYNTYAKLFNKTELKCHLVMVRLTLWQLWRDCNIIIKGLSLMEIDDYIVENETCFMKKSHHPFEKIEIWQFLHALIEVSWRLYYWKNDKAKKNRHCTHGILATCLHQFLTHDVYPNVGNFVGLVPHEYNNVLPLCFVHKLYMQIEYPQTAVNMLIKSVKDHKVDVNACSMPPITLAVAENVLNGVNCVTIGNRINFLPNEDKCFIPTKVQTIMKWQKDGTNDLLVLRELGPSKIIDIMAKVCPLIKDYNSNIILNMNYTFTFLEFFEIILEASKCIIKTRNIKKNKI